jgi:phosphoribosylformylglycinamidine (FGAM) synthase-like enzyme
MNYLRPVLSVSLMTLLATATVASADPYDSAMATIQKAGPNTAKVMVDKATYMAPITFGDGADWSSVKDHYEVSPVVVSSLKMHKLAISVGSDGTASFTKTKK